MNLLFVIAFLSTIIATFAQTIELGYPTDGTVIKAGGNVTVQVIRPVGLEKYPLLLPLTSS